MNRHSARVRFVCAVTFACLAAKPASAQREIGPYSGLFGAPQGDGRQALDLHGSFFGAYNRDRVLRDASMLVDPRFEESGLVDPRLQQSGMLGGATGSLAYQRHTDRAGFFVDGTGSLLEYAARPGVLTMFGAGAGLSSKLGRKVSFDATGSASYSPFYQFTPFQQFSPFLDPGSFGVGGALTTGVGGLATDPGLSAPGYGFAAVSQRNAAFGGAIAVSTQYSKRSSVGAEVYGHEFRFLDSAGGNLQRWGGNASFRHNLTRTLVFHAGYGREQVRQAFSISGPFTYQRFDVGLDYGDAVSFKLAPRTTLAFTTSASAVSVGNQMHYRVNGRAMLTRGFARTWSASLEYDRQMQFLAGFGQPLLSDSVGAGLGGLVAPRVQWTSHVGLSRGSIGFTGQNSFTAYGGGTGIHTAITRSVGAFAQYVHYQYRLPAGSTAFELAQRLSRDAVNVGLTVWVPIIKSAR